MRECKQMKRGKKSLKIKESQTLMHNDVENSQQQPQRADEVQLRWKMGKLFKKKPTLFFKVIKENENDSKK